MRLRAPDHGRALRAMQEAVDRELAAARTGGGRAAFGVDATRVARGPGGFLYRVDPPPEATLVEDAPAWLTVGERAVEGRLGSVADESCLVEVAEDLGPRVLDGRLVVDNLGPLRGLGQRLAALAGEHPHPPTFRFDQAELVLGTPGGRLNDALAEAASSAEEWRYDDRVGDLLRSVLRQRWAQMHTPPGTDANGLVARLLERLLALDARVLYVAPTGAIVDRTVGALCERLARSGRLGSGLVQRVGPLAPGAVRDRWGPFVEPATIAADLRAGVDARLADLDRAEGRMRYDELDRIAGRPRPPRPTWTPSWSVGSAPAAVGGTAASTRTRWSSAGTSCAARAATPAATPTGSHPSWPPASGRCRPWRTWSGPAEARRTSAAGWPRPGGSWLPRAATWTRRCGPGCGWPRRPSGVRTCAGCRGRTWTCSCWRVPRSRRRRTTWPACRRAA